MKYLLICLSVFWISVASALGSIEVQLPQDIYDIDEAIELTIDIESSNESPGKIEIIGLEDHFRIIGQNQSQSTQSINGVSSTRLYFQIRLLAYQAGSYQLGPVTLSYEDGEILTAPAREITITGERITINPNLGGNPQTSPAGSGGISSTQDLSNIDLRRDVDQNSPVLGLDGTVMQDIYDIKANIYPSWFSFPALILAVIIMACSILIQKLRIWERENPATVPAKKTNTKNYIKELKKIEKYSDTYEKQVFYSKLGTLFRSYLDEQIQSGLSGKTLKEVRQLIPKRLHHIYQTLYFPAYDTTSEDAESRQKIVQELATIFKQQ